MQGAAERPARARILAHDDIRCRRDRRWEAGRPHGHRGAGRGRKAVILLDQEPEASLGGQAFWSFGGLFFVNSPEQRRLGIRVTARPRPPGLAGPAGFDRRGRPAPAVGRGVRRLRRGEKRAWLRAMGHRIFPVVGVGGTWRNLGDRAWQLGSALPYHVGDGPGVARALRAPGARGGGRRTGDALLPPPGHGAQPQRRRDQRRARRATRTQQCRARRSLVAPSGW
ncbi:MAG: FAD-binding protein [Gemmatimonadetes bacterium]|nr:FAD-binding protein [Gemmatimonadota bacterium]